MKRRKRNKLFEKEFARFQRNFGIVVTTLRKKRKLNRYQLAATARISKTTLDHIEQGKTNPSLVRLESLAAALKYRLSYIFKLAQDMDEDK